MIGGRSEIGSDPQHSTEPEKNAKEPVPAPALFLIPEKL
jgi:hypothetical protein